MGRTLRSKDPSQLFLDLAASAVESPLMLRLLLCGIWFIRSDFQKNSSNEIEARHEGRISQDLRKDSPFALFGRVATPQAAINP
jgi:hypothetical protein